MVFIGLDVSKISTALTIEKNGITKLYSYSTLKPNNTWVKLTNDIINYRHVNYTYSKEEDYSKTEIMKLKQFSEVTDLIIQDIKSNLEDNEDVIIGIEGYSYSSSSGPIIDIVEFTTTLKYKLLQFIDGSKINIFSPITVKMETCKIAYEPRIEITGKKILKEVIHYENKDGKNATKFDKWDMFYALLYSDIKLELKDWCIDNKDIITKNKDVFKPLDDAIDSMFIMNIVKKQYNKND